jgi:hypothetical protein
LTLNNVTIAFNVADANEGGLSGGDGGGVLNNFAASISNSIVALNTDKSPGGDAPDCFNNFTSSGRIFTASGPNLIQNTDGCEITGDVAKVIQADPQFDGTDLADHGGKSLGDPDGTERAKTLGLAGGSPAIDAGDDGICVTTDQTGAARPADGNGDGDAHCDLGAIEIAASSGGTTGGTTAGTTGGTTGGGTTGGTLGSGGCSLVR